MVRAMYIIAGIIVTPAATVGGLARFCPPVRISPFGSPRCSPRRTLVGGGCSRRRPRPGPAAAATATAWHRHRSPLALAMSPPRCGGRMSSTAASPSKMGAAAASSDCAAAGSRSPEEEEGLCPLPFATLPYRGAEVVVPPRLDLGDAGRDDDGEDFLGLLQSSLAYWRRNDYSSAWVRVPACRSSMVERLTGDEGEEDGDGGDAASELAPVPPAGFGFNLHHVNATTQTIVLKKWLKPGAEDKIPPFSTHQVGVAGFVLSDDNDLLLIKEWTTTASRPDGPNRSATIETVRTPSKMWKLPGGLLDAGESFGEAAIREVYEETGVRCEFESMLTFWHRHGLTYGQSDVYVVCLLRLAGADEGDGKTDRKSINVDPVEISDAKWMDVHEFLRTQDHPLILHVLRNVFRMGESVGEELYSEAGRIQPHVEIVEGFDVKFSQRNNPFPTYTARERK